MHCTDGQDNTISQRIEDALNAGTGITHSSQRVKASGYTHRRHHPRPCPLSVREPARSPARSLREPGPAAPAARHAGALSYGRFRSSEGISTVPSPMLADGRIQPTHSPQDTADGLMNRSLSAQKPVTQSSVTGSELRKLVAGVGFEPT